MNNYFQLCRTSIFFACFTIVFPTYSFLSSEVRQVKFAIVTPLVNAGVSSAHPVNRVDFQDLWKIWINRW